jgi:SPP1 gp7 family putative phage head morphogenesis protein
LKKDTKEIGHPLRDPDIRRLYWNMQIKRMDRREESFKTRVEGYFDDQMGRLIDKLQPSKTRYYRSKGIDELLNIVLEIKVGKETFIPVLTELLKDAGVEAMEFSNSDGAFNITSDISSWIERRAGVFLTSVNETTFEKLRGEFAASLAAEEGRDKLVKRIQETYGGIKKSRAQMIARTEVHGATQYGTMQGYKQAGMSIKIWVAVMDGATRDSHAAVDGEERPIDMAFSNGLMWPGDNNAPADEVINCRCVI